MKLIPAIDIIDGKCVRLTEGDYTTSKIYNTQPVEVAKAFEDNGMAHLHLVDLDGARSGRILNWKVLEKIAAATRLEIDFGGGVKSNHDLEIAFNSGASKITGGSIAVKNPELFLLWAQKYPGRMILGADVKNKMVAIHGWTETSEVNLFELIEKFLPAGVHEVICTDIARDGKLQGPNLDLYKEIKEKIPVVKLIASGGISGMDDIYHCHETGLEGVIIGKAIYEGKIELKQLREYIVHAG